MKTIKSRLIKILQIQWQKNMKGINKSNLDKIRCTVNKLQQCFLGEITEKTAKENDRIVQQQEEYRQNTYFNQVKYWKQYQNKTARREWDISDPRAVAKDVPAIQKECGLASGQIFQGEDPNQ